MFQVAVIADAAARERKRYDLGALREHERAPGAQEYAGPDRCLVRVEDEADHVQRLLVHDARLPRLQLDVQLACDETFEHANGHLEVALVVPHEQDVVHVEEDVVHKALVRDRSSPPVQPRLAQSLLCVVVRARGVVVG